MPENENPTNSPTAPITRIVRDNEDAELKAMNAIVAALSPLKEEQRLRALEYVLGRFNAVALQAPAMTATAATTPPTYATAQQAPVHGAIQDIRTFKESKSPRSANEMAALVAFYLSELAPAGERKLEIDKTDIERYFKLANFKLTAKAGQTLVNAKAAGYLDSAGMGQYKINPVGYNLVAYRMGASGAGKTKPRRTKNKKKSPRAKK
jgi:hypothetical protein